MSSRIPVAVCSEVTSACPPQAGTLPDGAFAPVWQCGRHVLSLDRPRVMGIVNVTPDSFSDGGAYQAAEAAIAHGRQLVDEGADILDIGGESTRPGAESVTSAQEQDRVLPVLEGLRGLGVPLSIDTRHAGTMRAALDAGADIINDIYALREPGALAAVAASGCGLCVMHMQGQPRTMQAAPHYDDVVADVSRFLAQRVQVLRQAGVAASRLMLDPGIGFGKTLAHNLTLLRRLREAGTDDLPWLVGASRKSMLGVITGRAVDQRLAGSLAVALAAVAHGASVVRVHDVAQTVDALAVWQAVAQAKEC